MTRSTSSSGLGGQGDRDRTGAGSGCQCSTIVWEELESRITVGREHDIEDFVAGWSRLGLSSNICCGDRGVSDHCDCGVRGDL